jgi:hypothetical protein
MDDILLTLNIMKFARGVCLPPVSIFHWELVEQVFEPST